MGVALAGCGGTHDGSSGAAGSSGATGAAGAPASAGGSSGASASDAPTWYQDVAPLVAGHCQGCHKEGGIAPFALESYAEARLWGSSFPGVLASAEMPPFLASDTADCKPRFGFKDDPRLSDDEVQLIQRWADAGTPEGDANHPARLPAPPELELTGAQVNVAIPASVSVEGTSDRFICFSLSPDLAPLATASGIDPALIGNQVLIDGAQVHPGNAAIVHHVLVYTDPDSQSAALAGDKGYYDCFGGPQLKADSQGKAPDVVLAWAPGATPITAPEGVAMAIPSKGRLVMQVHYHPHGAGQVDDSTSLQLRGYSGGIPKYVSTLALLGNFKARDATGDGLQADPDDRGAIEFRIPAGSQDHTESMRYTVPSSSPRYKIWTLGTHMHYVGTDMRIGLTRKDPGDEPAEECLLETPHWDFSWQRGYRYDVPIDQAPSVAPGDVIDLHCTYDNSMMNPHVQEALTEQGLDAPRDVVLGESTLDEMCLGVFGIAQKVSDLLK